MQMACRAKPDGLPAEFYASKDSQRMKYAYLMSFFLSKLEYQLKKMGSNILYFQLCLKTLPPLFNDNPHVPSEGGGGFVKK